MSDLSSLTSAQLTAALDDALDLVEETTEELDRAKLHGEKSEVRLGLRAARRHAREAVHALLAEAAAR